MQDMNGRADNFDEWYAALLTPAPVEPHGLIPRLAETMVSLSYDKGVRAIVKEIAGGNDVESLKVYLQAFIKEDFNQETKEGRFDPEVTYAVTHLLVDGSGHKTFARQWLETMGHTPEKAEAWFRDRMSLVTSSVDDLVYSQQRLGLATLVDDLFAMRLVPDSADFNKPSPFDEAFAGILPAKVHLARDVLPDLRDEAAAIFRYLHPEGLPQAMVFDFGSQPSKVPLLNTIWNNENLSHVLGAVHLAYGSSHQVARQQMVESIDRVLYHGSTRLWDPAHPDDSDRWSATVEWMGADVLGLVVNGDFLSGFGNQSEPATFFDALMDIPLENAIERLADLQAKGFHLDDFNTEYVKEGARPVRRNLLISAIGSARQDMAAWLLAQGCDPEITSGLPGALSPYEFAIEMEAQFKNSHAKEAVTHGAIADLMRTAKSKIEALKAIDELEDGGPGRRP